MESKSLPQVNAVSVAEKRTCPYHLGHRGPLRRAVTVICVLYYAISESGRRQQDPEMLVMGFCLHLLENEKKKCFYVFNFCFSLLR